MNQRPRLVVLSGPRQGDAIEISSAAPCSIGSNRDASLHLRDPAVSWNHAKIWLERDELFVEDLGSAIGTRVNGARIERGQLLSGDTLTVGGSEIRCEFPGSATEPSASMAPLGVAAAELQRGADVLKERAERAEADRELWRGRAEEADKKRIQIEEQLAVAQEGKSGAQKKVRELRRKLQTSEKELVELRRRESAVATMSQSEREHVERARQEVDALRQDLEQLRADKDQLNEALAKSETEKRETTLALQVSERDLERVRRETNGSLEQLESLRQQVDVERSGRLEAQAERLKLEAVELALETERHKTAFLERQLATQHQSAETKEQKLAEIESRLLDAVREGVENAAKATRAREQLESELGVRESLEKKVQELLEETMLLRSHSQEADLEIDSLRSEMRGFERAADDRARLEKEATALRDELETLRTECARLTAGEESLRHQLAETEAAARDAEVQSSGLRETASRHAQQTAALERELADSQRHAAEASRRSHAALEELETLRRRLGELETRSEAREASALELKSALDDERQRAARLQEQLRSETAQLKGQEEKLAAVVESLSTDLEEAHAKHASDLLELETFRTEFTQLQGDVVVMQAYVEELKQKVRDKDRLIREERALARRRMGDEAARLLAQKRQLEGVVRNLGVDRRLDREPGE